MSGPSGTISTSAATANIGRLAGGEQGSARGHDAQVTRDRLMEVFTHCADLGIQVEWAHLGEYVRGGYEWRSGRIYLSLLLTAAQAVSTLVHELGHHKFGDRCHDPAAERRAWEYGAAFLISPEEYREAERLVGHHASALAIELGVTPKLIEAWRRWWQTRGHLLTDLQLGAGEGQ